MASTDMCAFGMRMRWSGFVPRNMISKDYKAWASNRCGALLVYTHQIVNRDSPQFSMIRERLISLLLSFVWVARVSFWLLSELITRPNFGNYLILSPV